MVLPPEKTLPQLVRETLARPRAEAIVERAGGAWKATSSAQLLERVERLAAAIRGAGLRPGDRVALISHDCIDWIVAAFATLFADCVVVPIYPTQALDQTGFILGHSGAKLLFVDTPEGFERLRGIGALPHVVVFSGHGSASLETFERSGEHAPRVAPAAAPGDLAVLIYTSGTTGDPKGVMLTHDNIAFDAQSAKEYGFQGIGPGEDILSVLPFSHIFEHTMIYIYLIAGVRYFVSHDPAGLAADLSDVRPVSMTAVPRIFDRVLAAVTSASLAHGGAQARLVPWALRAGREYAYAKTFERASMRLRLRYAVAKVLVLRKIRKRLGLDRLVYFTSGSAALHVDTAMTFLGLELPIMQGYGLTETSPVATVSRFSDNLYGAVGKPIPGVELAIAEDGEILTRGRHVMKGYYRDDAATAAAIENGWLHTGDVGTIDERGFLSITDRKRELFKTAGGKFIAPARVESAIKRSIYVTNVMVVGDGRPHPIAVINANWEALRGALGIEPGIAPGALATRDDVVAFLTAEVERQTSDLATFEQVRRIVIIPNEFTVESGELSPAMKIKRRVVERQYAAEIENVYRKEARVHAHA